MLGVSEQFIAESSGISGQGRVSGTRQFIECSSLGGFPVLKESLSEKVSPEVSIKEGMSISQQLETLSVLKVQKQLGEHSCLRGLSVLEGSLGSAESSGLLYQGGVSEIQQFVDHTCLGTSCHAGVESVPCSTSTSRMKKKKRTKNKKETKIDLKEEQLNSLIEEYKSMNMQFSLEEWTWDGKKWIKYSSWITPKINY